MHACMDGWMDGWMDGLMDGSISTCLESAGFYALTTARGWALYRRIPFVSVLAGFDPLESVPSLGYEVGVGVGLDLKAAVYSVFLSGSLRRGSGFDLTFPEPKPGDGGRSGGFLNLERSSF